MDSADRFLRWWILRVWRHFSAKDWHLQASLQLIRYTQVRRSSFGGGMLELTFYRDSEEVVFMGVVDSEPFPGKTRTHSTPHEHC